MSNIALRQGPRPNTLWVMTHLLPLLSAPCELPPEGGLSVAQTQSQDSHRTVKLDGFQLLVMWPTPPMSSLNVQQQTKYLTVLPVNPHLTSPLRVLVLALIDD